MTLVYKCTLRWNTIIRLFVPVLLWSPFYFPELAEMKLYGITILLVLFCLLSDSVSAKPCLKKYRSSTAVPPSTVTVPPTTVRNALYQFAMVDYMRLVSAASEGGTLTMVGRYRGGVH